MTYIGHSMGKKVKALEKERESLQSQNRELVEALEAIRQVAAGETQAIYDDSEAFEWIINKITTLQTKGE